MTTTQGPWDGSPEHPFQFIQDGINHAVDNDTIFVFSGMYHEHVQINRSVNLISEDKNSTFVDADGTSFCVLLESGNIQVRGFTLQNSGTETYNNAGVSIKNLGAESHNNLIIGNIMKNNLFGIFALASHGNLIAQNLIMNNKNDGIYLEADDPYNTITMNTIVNNTGNGILVGDFDSKSNSISQNYILDNNQSGILSYGYNCMIYENFIGNSTSGIFVAGDKSRILRNNISDTQIGLQIELAAQCVVEENNFIRNQRDATFQYYFLQRIKLPYLIAPQITKWKGNYWEGYDTGPKVIPGKMIIDYFLGFYLTHYHGVPWVNVDFTPATNPHNSTWGMK